MTTPASAPPASEVAVDPLEQRVRALVAAQLDVDPRRLTPAALLGEDLGVDSLAAIELGMLLEDEFEISLPDEVLNGVHTYGDTVAVVRERAGTALDGTAAGGRAAGPA
ncbi:MAG: phosphopantetheine-binding protein [Actinomycetota bacterium]|nr:phosphopantetheine-binding protein [Actinomycetota bacterium]